METESRPTRRLFRQVDLLIRGEWTRPEDLKGGEVRLPAGTLTLAVLLLGAAYGLCMGLFGAIRGEGYGALHVLAVMAKVPLLFLLTLAVTAPSLYVFSALARSPLGFQQTVRLLLAATGVSVVVLASLGPVTAFFTFSTRSHPFMQVLNTVAFALAGIAGLAFLYRCLSRIFETQEPGRPAVEGEGTDPAPTAPRHRPPRPSALARRIFLAWLAIYGLVGAQMAWILRPFIGAPGLDEALFRPTESNIFEGILEALRWM